MRYRTTIIGLLILLSTVVAQGQIKIGGNVYGGGNHAEVKGSTKVTVKAGDIGAVIDEADERPLEDPHGRVFGGARMANVGGNTYVHIDGKSDVATGTPNYIVINHVYGGNDIAGRIGTAKAVGEALPTELVGNRDDVDDTYNSYVHVSTKLKDDDSGDPAADAKKIFIGQLFAGGNGNFNYEKTPGPGEGKVTYKIYNKNDDTKSLAELIIKESDFHFPELEKTYLDIQGGTIFFAYGGGNNATVKEKTVIHVDNPSTVVTDIKVDEYDQLAENGTDLLKDDRVKYGMGIRLAQEHIDSPEFQIGRLFGGNNLAEMTIRPTWNLQAGKIRNLYSGGNRGAMTSPEGLLLEIDPLSTNKHPLIVDNVYGGCRMADVMPAVNGVYSPCPNLQDKDEHGNLKYNFPIELSARVLVRGGDINNVYGGNDVAGKVYGGDAVGIYTTVRGDVYGGGNGSYAYTDNDHLENDDDVGDFYYKYNPEDYPTSVAALNAFRPNAEQVSIRLKGTDAEHPTIIKGSVYLGGNCASLASLIDRQDALVELKIGSHVIADKVFLGNNGEKMIDPDVLTLYNGYYNNFDYSTLELTGPSVFASYMDGVAMPLRPNIVFDDGYIDRSSYIGSFYCGGNKGSMTAKGKTSLKFNKELIIYEKIVGGCNDANVEAGEKNAAYKGGVLGSSEEQTGYTEGGKIKDRIELNLDNVLIEPKRWDDTFAEITADDIEDGKLKAGEEYYTTNLRSSRFIAKGTEDATIGATDKYYKLKTKGSTLEWNTAKWDTNENDFVKTGIGPDGTDDEKRRLLGGNVYGGCYNSGHINGNVVINLNHDLIKRDEIFAEVESGHPYTISGARHTGVLREAQGDDVMAVAMSLFGGGYGEDTEVWGSATVNLNNGYVFQAFGGGEEGIVGNPNDANEGNRIKYSTTVNLKGPYPCYAEGTSDLPLAEAEYIYGGGSEGDVLGDSYVYLGNGRVYDAFGGASNADIYGGTEVYIGYDGGFPWIRNNVYGGNDFGGTVKGKRNHTTAITRSSYDDPVEGLLQSATYVKYIQGRVGTIFGGNYGYYDYTERIFKDYTDEFGKPLIKDGDPIFSFPHLDNNSFVHFEPVDNAYNQVNYIFGGSEGFPGNVELNNTMQKEAYVLIDDTQTKDVDRFAAVDIYGGGSYAGVGTSTNFGAGRTAVDLFGGRFNNVYGGCNQEGLVGYTRVNVPSGSTVKVNALFGGGKGYDPDKFDTDPALAERYCDHYVTCVDYKSKDAIVNDAIYGGNQNCRISADTYINIEAPVMQSSGYQATIYGAGYGKKTVSGRTNVFMNNGSNAYKVFGGGRDGNVFNYASLIPWLTKQFRIAVGNDDADVSTKVDAYGGILRSFATYLTSNPITLPNHTGTYVNASGEYNGTYTNDILTGDFHQTNVHIMNGANVSGYAYGGGLGTDAVVAGTTYIELKGGNVDKDIYGGGQGGPVFDEFNLKSFVATTNVYIEGGMARNVYGGGYLGHVGKHTGEISASNTGDIPAVANVTIGKTDGIGFYNGVPAITRNVYGGGEGGSVYGTANLTINNGYVGYRYKDNKYVEELDDQAPNAIEKAGNAFGGGYVVNSYVDKTNVKMYGGTLRGSLYGGGEIGPIGRGTMKDGATGGISNGKATIYKAGKTHVELYDGHVLRNVFGGGRGHDSWGGDGTKFMRDNMTEEEFANLDLKCKGYVFGQTEVDIFGGEVGTDEGVAQGYGNVFGGGDIGCVYSAYEKANGTLCFGKKNGTRYDGLDNSDGYYYKYENNAFASSGGEYFLTEDCKVLVEPWCKATSAVTINDVDYTAGTYVPTSALNYLGNKTASASDWGKLGKTDVNKEGVIIHNAVFAGGNTSPGSTDVYANTTTVFGNATASIHDVYNRDLISIGRGRVGGLYGDGNLTLVDGYRELNITNYGTDYYHIQPEITLAVYDALPKREQAYYEIRYKCLVSCEDKNGKTYAVGSTITADEMVTVFEGVKVNGVSMIQADGKPLETYWKENGVCSRYAGRPMNTLQRADFCGVFGSRMVMQGAQDRVPATVDYTNYTINRVREVSLNKKVSVRSGDASDSKNKEHGNYFGIYSVVNFLGALTSDVDFGDEGVRTDKRTSDNSDTDTYQATANGKTYGNASFYDWKKEFHEDRRRNNGNSHNKLALASGVYLELTSEKSTGKGLNEKDWGYITGVVELDLINVQPGMGGGYVYAKNEHGTREATGKTQTILTALNTGAATNKKFSYVNTAVSNQKEWETSGNFVHSTQTIIDDCYNIGGKYKVGESPVPAHYWFIRGAVYIYDQYISAYTGSPNAFSETVSIPLTITSASHGKMTLLNVQPNYYAYYSVNTNSTKTKLGENDKIELRDKEYGLNDAITYWDYSQLTAAEKNLFVDETYVVIADCTLGGNTYKAGTVLLPGNPNGSEADTYYYLKKHAPTKKLDEDDVEETPYVHHVSRDMDVDFDYVFRPSNNVSHNTGYILTYNIDNPNQWNTWYTPKTGTSLTGKVDSEEIKSPSITSSDYENAPTYTPNTTSLYGQDYYTVGRIISKDVYDTYQSVKTNHSTVIPSTGQAEFYPAYIVTADLLETTNKSGTEQRLHKGATLSKENYSESTWSSMSSSVAEAYVVTKTIQLSNTEFVYRNTYLTASEINDLKRDYPALTTEIVNSVVPAYYCTTAGKYGGNYYEAGHNYRALAAFTAMSEDDRANFNYNYDALDLLIDPTYSRGEGVKYQYDGNYTSAEQVKNSTTGNKATYSLATPIDYTATYKGTESLTYTADDNSSKTATNGTELSRTEYERLPNEQYYWAPIKVGSTSDTYYVVKQTIVLGDTPYAAGQVISSDTYDGLSVSDKAKVASLKFSSTGDYYYCREAYTIPNNSDGHAVTSATGVTGGTSGTYAKNTEVPTGVVISKGTYETLTNNQKNFSIHGLAPTETSSLYVTGGSDIFDLSAEKIITVIYQYDYVESDMAGTHITPVSERHVLNIHLNFKSGVPTVEDIQQPDIILPGTTISIAEPYVTPGAYEITGGGWKLFDTASDAESHINGVEYTPSDEALYLYQNKHYLAYYAKTYLGETFSNHVPVSVANYHDLKKVMNDKDHHYYIDHKEIFDRLKIEPKIYINDYSKDAEGSKNGLDLFKDLYDLSLVSASGSGYTVSNDKITATTEPANSNLVGHALLNSNTRAERNLEFILRTDIEHTGSWTPIGYDGVCDNPSTPNVDEGATGKCFDGVLHGDGHTISGLNNSLFNYLCGEVYNLGVTGSFTGAGIAENGGGYVESCWVNTTGTPNVGVRAVFGNPSAASGYKQVVNSYCQEGKTYSTTDTDNHGLATAKSDRAFYNGEVAYDLNNFYLYKRYNDNAEPKPTASITYKYWQSGKDKPQDGSYAQNEKYCSSGYNGIKYVEDRFADGDFRYAGGSIPNTEDERHWTETVTSVSGTTDEDRWSPIWPDDYIFFGQKLNYGYAVEPHQNVPTAVVRNSSGRLSDGDDANRVYRAPAYYGSKVMGVAHFNPSAYLAQKSSDGTKEAYPGLTAIDFAGHNDVNYTLGANGMLFYQPLLDDDGLTSIVNKDVTQNLLVYAPAASASGTSGYVNAKTYDVLTDYFEDPAYSDYYNVEKPDNYRAVKTAKSDVISSIYGHLVKSTLTADNDHLLVDKQDFNCPIPYDFDKDHLMWYQRTPEDQEYVDLTKGWQGISIPFTAELVTTNEKGEITHFYSDSETSKNSDKKIGHEYWLRELEENSVMTLKSGSILKANFHYPSAAGDPKDFTNTFFWDYYYKNTTVHNQKDANGDTYQENYGKGHTYTAYPLLSADKPYILGLPGKTYYEFDLSGEFEAENTSVSIPKLGKQTITFVSNKGDHIGVSDDEMKVTKVTYDGHDYYFKPNYMNKSLAADNGNYALNDVGDSYVLVSGEAKLVSAFRPYFSTSAVASSRKFVPQSIAFGSDYSGLEEEPTPTFDGGLEIYAKDHKIITASHLKSPVTISIVNVAGVTYANYVLQPGETQETRVQADGVYIVNRKKLLVK